MSQYGQTENRNALAEVSVAAIAMATKFQGNPANKNSYKILPWFLYYVLYSFWKLQ